MLISHAGIFECGLAVGEFLSRLVRGCERQIRMGEGVVPYFVAGGQHAAREFRLLAHEFPDHEEGGADVVLSEYVEQRRRAGRVRSVVKGERDLLPATRRSEERRAVELRLRQISVE